MNILCVSHLRWHFVFQRPQHLLSRAAKTGTVLYVEEPVEHDGAPEMQITLDDTGVLVGIPHLPAQLSFEERISAQRRLIAGAAREHLGEDFVLWLYTPMAIP